MISDVSIDNFRGFESLRVQDVSRLSLLSGRNNIGKSTLLEALFLFMDHVDSNSFATLSGSRGSSLGGHMALWEPLFNMMDTDREIRICVSDRTKQSRLTYRKDRDYLPYVANGLPEDAIAAFRTVANSYYSLLFTFDSGEYHEEGHFFLNGTSALREMKTSRPGNEVEQLSSTRWLRPATSRISDIVLTDIGNLELKGRKEELIAILRELDPTIEDVVTLSIQGVAQLYMRTSGKLLPIQYAGDGILKLLQICLAAMELEDGILLIDEVESGFHYSMYGKLWTMLDRISASSGCQVVATTHSYEMIAAVRGSLKHTDDFSYYRIARGKQGHVAYRYDYEMLDSALRAELEVR